MMELHNPYVHIYRTAKQRLNAEEHMWLCFKTVWITADTIILPSLDASPKSRFDLGLASRLHLTHQKLPFELEIQIRTGAGVSDGIGFVRRKVGGNLQTLQQKLSTRNQQEQLGINIQLFLA
jgi:hypothetical protein